MPSTSFTTMPGTRNGTRPEGLRFLFTTLGHVESDFYGRVGAELRVLGHEAVHITFSRRGASVLRRRGFEARCLADAMDGILEGVDVDAEVQRISAKYPTTTFRDIYRTDFVHDGRSEAWAVRRTVAHMLALESLIDSLRPDILIPEVGNETIRVATHLIGLQRGLPVFFLLYTIFDEPLRLYVDSMHALIVEPHDIKALTSVQRAEVEDFIARFMSRAEPIRPYRDRRPTAHRARMLARHLLVRALWDRNNDYLTPIHWLLGRGKEAVRARLLRRYYEQLGKDRRYVYFPLHVTDDYKIKRVIPHCADQASIIEQVARSLPHGYDLVVKEHPMAIGRTPCALIRRLHRSRNIRVVAPRTSSHDLIRDAVGVAVISSTVGLEALLYNKPVLTLGQPFYSQLGLTVDVFSFADIPRAVPQLLERTVDPEHVMRFLHAAMQRCLPGAPVAVDRSDENARTLARSLAEAAVTEVGRRRATAPDPSTVRS